MLLQHLHMASDIFPELHKINTQKKGNKRIKPCLEKKLFIYGWKHWIQSSAEISSAEVQMISQMKATESDTWLGFLVTAFFCCDNKCIHPTQQISIFTLQAFNRVTCCDEHKLFWAQLPPFSDTFDSSRGVCDCLRENKHVTLCIWSSSSYTPPPYARHKNPVQKYSASKWISPGRALLFTEPW